MLRALLSQFVCLVVFSPVRCEIQRREKLPSSPPPKKKKNDSNYLLQWPTTDVTGAGVVMKPQDNVMCTTQKKKKMTATHGWNCNHEDARAKMQTNISSCTWKRASVLDAIVPESPNHCRGSRPTLSGIISYKVIVLLHISIHKRQTSDRPCSR